MDSLLDFEECVKDSPEFRLKLELFEADVNVLETHLDKVMKLCGKMVEAGQVYNAANQLFLSAWLSSPCSTRRTASSTTV
ncbi:hypothetical protein CgunFtcFv8_010135 [Champsocephalus gunnari]|uniref:BAR domain-containing protein n=1 Tax=Champsocephalus gunnari TaxID=52237 RepID=A0AAN8HUG8_CHAGU|nr:hypothetical protein CgunFtcFv8_010135 [Champsocephalus gunnari]